MILSRRLHKVTFSDIPLWGTMVVEVVSHDALFLCQLSRINWKSWCGPSPSSHLELLQRALLDHKDFLKLVVLYILHSDKL